MDARRDECNIETGVIPWPGEYGVAETLDQYREATDLNRGALSGQQVIRSPRPPLTRLRESLPGVEYQQPEMALLSSP
jgi:hypothetical protein